MEKKPNAVDMSSFMMFEAIGDSEDADSSSDNFYDHVSYRCSSLHGILISGTVDDEDDAESCVGSSIGDDVSKSCYNGDEVQVEEDDDEYEVDDQLLIMTMEEEHEEDAWSSADSAKDCHRQVINHRQLMSPARVPESDDKLFWEACLKS